MRVLCTETSPGVADDVREQLRAAGHEVVGCHADGGPAFPCVGVQSPGSCPLDLTGGVDAAVTVRRRAHPRPTLREMASVTCALRQGIPLVVAGHLAHDPFSDVAVATVPTDRAVDACEDALRDRLLAMADAVTHELRWLVPGDVAAAGAVRVEVRRRHDRALELIIHRPTPVAAAGLDMALAVRAHRAARELDPDAPRMSISCTD